MITGRTPPQARAIDLKPSSHLAGSALLSTTRYTRTMLLYDLDDSSAQSSTARHERIDAAPGSISREIILRASEDLRVLLCRTVCVPLAVLVRPSLRTCDGVAEKLYAYT
jgi:hypothetical protein